jgi:hypothetical protein
MENDVLVMHTACFLEPVDAVRVFTRLSRYIRSAFQSSVDPGRTWEASTTGITCSFDSLRNQLSANRRQFLSDLYIRVQVNPDFILDLRAANGDSLLHYLCRKGESYIVQLILSHAILDMNQPGAADMTLLHCSAFSKNMEMCKFLINHRADPGTKDSIGRLPEDWATVQGAHDLCTFLRRSRKGKHVNNSPISCFSWLSTS